MKKLTLPKQILSAVLAVVLTAGLGTAALASSDPIRSANTTTAPSAAGEQLPPSLPGDLPSGEPGASQEPNDTNAPAENAGQLPEKPEDNTAPSGEPNMPSDEAGIASGEPNASAENEKPLPEKPEGDAAPSGEPSAPSGEPNAPSGDPNAPSGEPSASMEPTAPNAPADGKNAPDGQRHRFDVMGLLRNLLQQLQGLFAPRQEMPAAHVSPAFQPQPQPASGEGSTEETDQTTAEDGATGTDDAVEETPDAA